MGSLSDLVHLFNMDSDSYIGLIEDNYDNIDSKKAYALWLDHLLCLLYY